MKNIKLESKANLLIVTIDMSKSFGPSKSGKTEIIASTGGNRHVPGTDAKLGLNLYKAREL